MEGDFLRLRDTYIWPDEVQEQGLKMVTQSCQEASHTLAELAKSQHQKREFMARVLDCFAMTYK